jgi:hypothetical protein
MSEIFTALRMTAATLVLLGSLPASHDGLSRSLPHRANGSR